MKNKNVCLYILKTIKLHFDYSVVDINGILHHIWTVATNA